MPLPHFSPIHGIEFYLVIKWNVREVNHE